MLVTSGIDGVYPAGPPVAKVAMVDRNGGSPFARIVCTHWPAWAKTAHAAGAQQAYQTCHPGRKRRPPQDQNPAANVEVMNKPWRLTVPKNCWGNPSSRAGLLLELCPGDCRQAAAAGCHPQLAARLYRHAGLYWTLNQPRRFGIGWSFGIGLIADVASASVFGQHALAIA